jgi:thymidylate synthase
MNKADFYYKQNLEKILNEGCIDENPRPKYKDGSPAHSTYITQVFEEYDINKGEFPITTLRNTAIKTGIKEILWIYQKQTSSLEEAHKLGINWWDNWDIGDGTIGQRYGATIKKYNLLNNLIKGLKEDPFSRRHIIDMYQYQDMEETKGLHPCAYSTIFSVRKLEKKMFLDMTLHQRSNDYIMAGYINKIQYVALQMMIASECGFEVGKFCHFVQNLHIYDRHLEAAKEILNNEPLEESPSISLNNSNSFYYIQIEHFTINNIRDIPKLKSELEIAI